MLAACVFVSMVMPVPMSASAVTWVCGDVNNDGSVSLSDVTSFNKYLNGMVDLVDYTKADTNADCVVDVVDRMILSNYITRVITSLPYTADGGGYASATTATTAVNSGMGYTVFNPDDGTYASSYYLDVNPIQDNSKIIVGDEDARQYDYELSGVVKIRCKKDIGGYLDGTGFVIDDYIIVTSAHNLINSHDLGYEGDFQDTKYELEKITIHSTNEVVEEELKVITDAYEIHIPNAYITNPIQYGANAVECSPYDYALIVLNKTDENKLSEYACFNLGIPADGIMGSQNKLVYNTGYSGDSASRKHTGTGYIVSDQNALSPERNFYHNIDTSIGHSGSPVYVKTQYTDPSTQKITTYNTVIGIHSCGIDSNGDGTLNESDANCAVQMTTDMLHFFKNNPYV